jgi:hypothetical protein
MIDRLTRLITGVSFGRGIALGALVGAAIAGSTLWSRVRDARSRPENAKDGAPDR